jgi:hypothetical protein
MPRSRSTSSRWTGSRAGRRTSSSRASVPERDRIWIRRRELAGRIDGTVLQRCSRPTPWRKLHPSERPRPVSWVSGTLTFAFRAAVHSGGGPLAGFRNWNTSRRSPPLRRLQGRGRERPPVGGAPGRATHGVPGRSKRRAGQCAAAFPGTRRGRDCTRVVEPRAFSRNRRRTRHRGVHGFVPTCSRRFFPSR